MFAVSHRSGKLSYGGIKMEDMMTGGFNAEADSTAMVFNLDDVDENAGGSMEVMPKGEYACIVDEMTFGESSKGSPMITVVYQVVEGEFEGRKLWDYWVLNGKGAEFGLAKLKKFLARICPEVGMNAFNPATFCDSGDAIGRDCLVKVKIQTQKAGDYKGEKRNQVQDVQAGSTGTSFI